MFALTICQIIIIYLIGIFKWYSFKLSIIGNVQIKIKYAKFAHFTAFEMANKLFSIYAQITERMFLNFILKHI